MSKINSKSIKEVEFTTTFAPTDDTSKSSFEILKITSCPSTHEAFKLITSQHFHDHFQQCKSAFVIVIECADEIMQLDDDELSELSNCYRDKKVMIISLESKEASEIYYKQLNEDEFKAIKENNQLDETFNFAALPKKLNSQNFGKFTGKLLETTVDTRTCYDGKRLIDFAVESNKILSIRFLQLFNFNLRLPNENKDRPLELAARHPTMDAFIALLKFKFEFWNDELCKCDYNLLHLRTIRDGYTLLMLAAESGNTGAVNFLVKFGVDKNYEVNGETAVTLAWKNRHYETFLQLLKFDSKYPKNFAPNLAEKWEILPKELKKFISTVDAFHIQLSTNDHVEYEKVLQNYPNMFHFYNKLNQSAAGVAIRGGHGNVLHYDELIRKGIYISCEENIEEIFKNVDEGNVHGGKDQKGLSGKNLITLMSKSHIGYSTSYEEKRKKVHFILKTFQSLHQIDSMRPLLNIFIAHPIKIIFDFNRLSINQLHAEVDDICGSMYNKRGYIYVGAKNLFESKKECEVLANLARKLLHYSLQIIYNNDSKPYMKFDYERESEFEEILKICEQEKLSSGGLKNIFEACEGDRHAELIASVPQTFALYHSNDEKRKNFIEKFKKLFSFYERRIQHDLKCEWKDLKLKKDVFEVNHAMGVVESLRESKIKLKNESLKVNVSIKDKSLIYLSNCPSLTLQAIYQRHKVESYHLGSSSSLQSQKSDCGFYQQRLFIYTTIDKLSENNTVHDLKALLKSSETSIESQMVVNCDTKSIKMLKNIAKKFHPHKLTFIIDLASNTINRDVLSKTFELRDVKHLWTDLTLQTQQKLMQFPVIFQGKEMKLCEFLKEGSPIWKEVPLNYLVNDQFLQISERIENDTKYYVRRKFIDSTARCNRWDQERNEYVDEYDKPIKTFDEISGTEGTKVILLLDETKAGKTSTFKSIATRLKDKFINKWIIFIDHKHHADVYRTCKSTEWNQNKLAQFISQEILELKDFEQKIFEEFFVEGRVVILLEMNVFYQEILDFAVRIVELSQNQLWISSWPQHADKLEAAFKISAFKLVPFDSENRREFFIKFLNSKGIEEEEEVERRLKELEDFLQLHSKEDNFPCDIPLMLRMIAEVYENSLADPSSSFPSNNLFSIYQSFISRTLGPLASNSRLNIMQLHQKYALKEVFCRKKKNDCEELVKSLQIMMPRAANTNKKIFACGIMYKLEHGKLKFIHKTFAEFFVAQYIIDNILNASAYNCGGEAGLRCKLFLTILTDSNRCYKTIHRFLDNYIEMNEAELEERFDESCYTFLSTYKPSNFFSSLLWRLARHRCFYLIKFITEIYSDDEKILREMWGVVSIDGYSFLFKTIDKEDGAIDLTFTERVWNFACEVFHNRCDLIAILKTTLIRSSCSVFKNVFPQFWEFVNEFLTVEEKKEIFIKDALKLFTRNKTKKFFAEVCEIAESVLDPNEMKLFLTNSDDDGKTFLYHFSKLPDDEALTEFLAKIKQYLTIDEQKVLLTRRLRGMLEEDKKTPPKSFQALWEFAEQQLDKSELRSLLLTKNTSGFTIFHETIIDGDEKAFNFMVEIHERILDKEDLKDLITRKFQGNKTLLFKTLGVSIESILMLWDYIQDLLDDDEQRIKKFLAHRDDFGDTAFSSMKWYDAFPNDLFMPFISENFSKHETEKLFEKVTKSTEVSSATELISENEAPSMLNNDVESSKQKFFRLNCFCCIEDA